MFCVGLCWRFLVYRGSVVSAWWLAVPGVVFAALVFATSPSGGPSDRARRSVQFYSRGLARLDGRWAGTGVTGLEYLDLDHPYAADLDLFGVGSLFERLVHGPDARRRGGARVVAAGSGKPARRFASGTRRSRELRPRLDLREDLELLGVEVRAGIDPAALAAWGTARRVFPGPAVPIAAAILGALGTAALVGWLFFETALLPLAARLDDQRGVRPAGVAHASGPSSRPSIGGRTTSCCSPSCFAGWKASRSRRRLSAAPGQGARDRRTSGLGADQAPGATSAPARLQEEPVLHAAGRHLALDDSDRGADRCLAERIRATNRRLARAIGEFEALCALAAYAAENPDDPFAELVDGPACFEAEAVGHPLIQAERLRSERRRAGGRDAVS